jgi:hypothetical protein
MKIPERRKQSKKKGLQTPQAGKELILKKQTLRNFSRHLDLSVKRTPSEFFGVYTCTKKVKKQ